MRGRFPPRFVVLAAVLGTSAPVDGAESPGLVGSLWPADVPLSTAPSQQGVAELGAPGLDAVEDGHGGVFVAWDDAGTGKVFVQHLAADGSRRWGPDGVDPATGSRYRVSPRLVADGSGGVIVAWVDGQSQIGFFDVYSQRLSSSGQPLWTATGVPVVTAELNQGLSGLAVVSDGSGGAIVAWEDGRPPHCCRFYAQRIDATGHPIWPLDGIPLSPPPTVVTGPVSSAPLAVADGMGGAIFAWLDVQTFPGPPQLAIRRFDASGQPSWPGPVNVGSPAMTNGFSIASDGAGGVLATWSAPEAVLGFDVFAQRLNGSGAPLWPAVGVRLTAAPLWQAQPEIIGDGTGGAIVAWRDNRNDTFSSDCFGLVGNCDIYAQRVDATGQVRWAPDGQPVSTAVGNQFAPRLVPDGRQGAMAVWHDCRAFPGPDLNPCAFGMDLYAQWLDADGQARGPVNGALLSGAAGNQGVSYGSNLEPSTMVAPDGAGGAIVIWPDGRNGFCAYTSAITTCDVFAQRTAPDVIFGHGFEPGLTGWSSVVTDGGDLSVSAASGMAGTASGLEALVDDTAPLFVQDETPVGEGRYRVRFYFDPNGFDPGETQGHLRTRLLIAFGEEQPLRLLALVLRRREGQYDLRARVRLDDGTRAESAVVPLATGAHLIELDWRRATSADASDGSLEMWVDGVSVASVSALDNGLHSLARVRLGALSVKNGALGTLRFDEFESRRLSYIGPRP